VVSGGVVTAEKAWDLCKMIQENDTESVMFDVSSYEYSISLLCQALRTEDAETRIVEMKSLFGVKDASNAMSQSVTESLSLSYLALARAHSILSQRDKTLSVCQHSLDFAKASHASLKSDADASSVQGTLNAIWSYYYCAIHANDPLFFRQARLEAGERRL
jgi:DNA-binding NtrC family response regulator